MNENVFEFDVDWKMERIAGCHGKKNVYKLTNDEVGEFIITNKALETLERITDSDRYKVTALVHEQYIRKNIFVISERDDEDPMTAVQCDNGHNYIPINVDSLLSKFPSNFVEIQRRALMNLYCMNKEYGQEIDSITTGTFFTKDFKELYFIAESMKKKDWIDFKFQKTLNDEFTIIRPIVITDEGWMELERTIKRNVRRQAFIAMKFKDMEYVYNAIYRAIDDAGFSPLRIDKKEFINQISDEIQYEISQSGLVVADLTGQNSGVYFEAGYAMGLNIPVVWTCKEDEVGQIHFDTRQYNTVLWKDENDLYEKLKRRIIAVTGLQKKDSSHD